MNPSPASGGGGFTQSGRNLQAVCIHGQGRTPRGVEWGGGQNRFSKNLVFERVAAKFFSKVSRGFSEGQKGSVNLTFNAFLHKNFSVSYIMVPGGHEGVV